MINLQTSYFRSSHIFKDSIERVYEVLRRPQYKSEMFRQYSLNIRAMRKQSDLFSDIGASFRISMNQHIVYEIVITDSKNEEQYKMMKARSISVYPFKFNYILTLSLYWCSMLKQTVLLEEILFIYNTHTNITNHENEYLSQVESKFNLIERYLAKCTYGLSQTESIIINAKYKDVCEAVINWKKFIRLSPLVGNSVIIIGNYKEVNSTIILYKGEEEDKFRVIRNEENESGRYYELLLVKGNDVNAPRQYLKFLFININNDKTFLSFTHEFIEPIKYSRIVKMEKGKKKILKDLKRGLEQ